MPIILTFLLAENKKAFPLALAEMLIKS